MSFTLTEAVAAGVIWYGLDRWINAPPVNTPSEPPTDVTTRRLTAQGKKSGGGSPFLINKLKYLLLGEGITPVMTDKLDPQQTEAELTVQILNMGLTAKNKASGALNVDRSVKCPGAKLIDFANLNQHRDMLLPNYTPEGN